MDDFSTFIDGISVNFYRAASELTESGNFLVSPISVIYASVLIYLGSHGTTKSNFESAYKFSDSQAIKPFADALSSLNFNKPVAQTGEVEMKFTNAIFLQSGLNVDTSYLMVISSQLHAWINLQNFKANPEGSRDAINHWVQNQTENRIKDLIPGGAIDGSTLAILANALYFKAAWQEEFNKDMTREDSFKLLNGNEVKVDFMNMKGARCNYLEDSNLEAQYLEIPYKSNDASLLVILPQKVTGLRAVEAALTKETFSRLDAGVNVDVLVDLSLPKFKVESLFDAKQLLKMVGVTEAFSDQADLTGIVPTGGLRISGAFHKTFVDVDEKGTEAAAATASHIVLTSLMESVLPETPIIFKADHPFLFAIRHNPSKLILFMGRVEAF